MINKEKMSPRERVKTALAGKETDRIPIAMVCSGINEPAKTELKQYLQDKNNISLEKFLEPLIDIKKVGPDYIGPSLQNGKDYWGVERTVVDTGTCTYSEISRFPLAEIDSIKELENYPWPSVEWFDFDSIPEKIKDINSEHEYCILASGGNVFEISWYMRGFEQMFMDMISTPEIAQFIFGKVTGFFREYNRKLLKSANGDIDLVFTADDLGSQEGLLMSLDMLRNFIMPCHQKLNEIIHSGGAKVIYHSCGAIMEAVPDLIDMGVDILQSLQFDARNMDPVALKEKFGANLAFEGGMSVQKTLPFGTVEDVINEAVNLIRILGENGKYIFGPAHVIQAGTPPENIVAMFETAVSAKI